MIFRRKRKVYKGSEMVNYSDPHKFMENLKDCIKAYQEKELEVEIHYHAANSFSALVLAYEVK